MSGEEVRIDVPHVKQKHNWDCGLACATMVLKYFKKDIGRMDQICKELNFGDSVWTIDLAHIMKFYSIQHKFYTVTLGVDTSYSDKTFYKDRYSEDERRVGKLFQTAADNGVSVNKESVSIDDVIRHLGNRHVVIVLIDWSYLNCKWCNSKCMPSLSCVGKCVGSYQGHFIVVNGYNSKDRLIYYHNPSYSKELCCCSYATFDKARKAHGTDQDILFIYDEETPNMTSRDTADMTSKKIAEMTLENSPEVASENAAELTSEREAPESSAL